MGRTILRYDGRYSDSIKTLAAAVPGARLVAVPGLGQTLQVVIGSQYAGTRAVEVSAANAAGVSAAETPAGRAADADPCSLAPLPAEWWAAQVLRKISAAEPTIRG